MTSVWSGPSSVYLPKLQTSDIYLDERSPYAQSVPSTHGRRTRGARGSRAGQRGADDTRHRGAARYAGGALVLATQSGTLARVQSNSPSRFSMGDVVQAASGSKLRVLGHRHHARVHGVVLRRGHGSYALAGNGAVLAVSSTTPPAVGQQVTADVQVGRTSLSCNHGDVQVRGPAGALG